MDVLEKAHSRIVGGHFTAETTTYKVLQAGIWWPSLFMDAAEFVKGCDECQGTLIPQHKDCMPLTSVMENQPFEKWGIDFVGPISPTAKYTYAHYLIISMDYYTKWAQERATKKANAHFTVKFLYE